MAPIIPRQHGARALLISCFVLGMGRRLMPSGDLSNCLRLVAEGGSGYFFGGPAEKIAVVKDRE